MAAYKDEERGTWYVSFHYTDWTGVNKRKMKRGFATRKDALEWEHHFLAQQSENMDMSFGDFVVIYLADMEKRLRESTMISKKYIINLKILPYFKDKKISEISAPDIRKWQTEIMKGNYAKTYLRSIQEQLSAIFNYAVKYFDLRKNPCHVAGGMGKHTADEMDFWTLEEFQQFIETMMNKRVSYMGFMILYWTGIRLGEMLALTVEDVDIEKKTLRINKSLQRLKGRDVVTEPKTPRSKRMITIPDVLLDDIKDYIGSLYGVRPTDRLIPVTKTFMEHEIKRGIHESGVKDIHIHCLRHSHTALIASLGATPVEAAERLGHEKVQTTLNIYSHVMPGRHEEIADKLDQAYKESQE